MQADWIWIQWRTRWALTKDILLAISAHDEVYTEVLNCIIMRGMQSGIEQHQLARHWFIGREAIFPRFKSEALVPCCAAAKLNFLILYEIWNSEKSPRKTRRLKRRKLRIQIGFLINARKDEKRNVLLGHNWKKTFPREGFHLDCHNRFAQKLFSNPS